MTEDYIYTAKVIPSMPFTDLPLIELPLIHIPYEGNPAKLKKLFMDKNGLTLFIQANRGRDLHGVEDRLIPTHSLLTLKMGKLIIFKRDRFQPCEEIDKEIESYSRRCQEDNKDKLHRLIEVKSWFNDQIAVDIMDYFSIAAGKIDDPFHSRVRYMINFLICYWCLERTICRRKKQTKDRLRDNAKKAGLKPEFFDDVFEELRVKRNRDSAHAIKDTPLTEKDEKEIFNYARQVLTAYMAKHHNFPITEKFEYLSDSLSRCAA